MLETVLNIVLAAWIGLGTIIVSVLIFLPAVTGKAESWTYAIGWLVFFLTGAAILHGNAYYFIDAQGGAMYDAYKGTAEILKFIHSKESSIGHTFFIIIYTLLKCMFTIIIYESCRYFLEWLLIIFGGEAPELGILKKTAFWILAMAGMVYVVSISKILNYTIEDYISYEGYISVIIAAVVLLKAGVKAAHNLCKMLIGRKNGRPLVLAVVSSCLLTLSLMLVISLNALIWGYVDRVALTFY